MANKPQITIKQYPADTSAAQAIIHGHVSAYFADAPPVLYYIRTTGGKFETAGQQVETAPEGIATRKGDALGKKIAAAVLALYHSGQMKTILAKWQASQFALKQLFKELSSGSDAEDKKHIILVQLIWWPLNDSDNAYDSLITTWMQRKASSPYDVQKLR